MTATNATVLHRHAAEMRQQLATGDGVTRCVYRRATIVLRRSGRQCTLSIGRKETPVAIEDAYTIARAFHVPAGIDPTVRTQNGYHIFDLTWLEDALPDLPANFPRNPLLAQPTNH